MRAFNKDSDNPNAHKIKKFREVPFTPQMTKATSQKVAELILTMGAGETQMELMKQNICRNVSFEPFAAFQRIDRKHKGYVQPRDIL